MHYPCLGSARSSPFLTAAITIIDDHDIEPNRSTAANAIV
jgi:hypothetical protein